MALYNELMPEFHRLHAEMIGISVDSVVPYGVREARHLHSPSWPISRPRETSRAATECIGPPTAPVNAPCL
jgi:hypothetical protein